MCFFAWVLIPLTFQLCVAMDTVVLVSAFSTDSQHISCLDLFLNLGIENSETCSGPLPSSKITSFFFAVVDIIFVLEIKMKV